MERENAWKTYKEKDKKELEQLNGDYIEFLSAGKTERECVRETIRQAEEKGYQSLESVLKKGQKLVLAGFGAGLSWGADILEWDIKG